MLSWPFVAMAIVGIEGLILWLRSMLLAGPPEYRCGTGQALAMVVISLVVNLLLAPVLRAVHLAFAPKNQE